ncbi:MAG: MFS transporter [Pseudomonas sp.]|uniref:MFS transporter n=1 Tax=Pseudomonas sp. TaxID=306 RepID=UPI0011FA85AF|nr:MFS transporter [Pseudomonas sp.]RZI68093.1 MAG: MFS transporter [Pseudomonas sp.]
MTEQTLQEAGTTGFGISPKQRRNAISASVLGWSLDLFDLFILLYVAPVVGMLFFPSTQPTLSLAAVYASSAVALIIRPLGSAIFGSYADTHGRKGAMTIALVGTGLSTAAFGLLPTIHQVGYIAPVLFLLLRLVQGMFIGGVVAATHTIGTESVSPRWRGTMSGFVGGGAALGALLAALVFAVVSWFFPGDEFAVWGWRCMFFSGLLSTALGLFIFGNLEESPYFKQVQSDRKAKRTTTAPVSPLRTLFKPPHRNVLLINLLITFGGGAAYYLTSGYMPSFLRLVNGLPNSEASKVLIAASVCAFFASLLVGFISDFIGRKRTFLLVGVLSIVLLPFFFLGMGKGKDVAAVMPYAIGLAFLGNAAYAPILIFLNERFPTMLRASGTGLSWNIGFALGGLSPTFVSLASTTMADVPRTLAIFAVGASAVYIVGALVVPETKGEFK